MWGLGITYQVTGIAASVVVVVIAAAAWVRWIRPRLRQITADVVAARDSLLGRPAVKDTITGRELAPELPGMGVRMASTEEQTRKLVETVTKLADQSTTIADLDRRISRLEEGAVERILGRAESTEAFRTMQAALHADPHDVPDVPPDRRAALDQAGVVDEPDTGL